MKSKEELRKEVHALIDSIDDEGILNMLHDDMVPYGVKDKIDVMDELSDEEQQELRLAIKESSEGENYSKEEFLMMLEK
jgi:hypothetical protein